MTARVLFCACILRASEYRNLKFFKIKIQNRVALQFTFKKLSYCASDCSQIFYADDGSAVGKLLAIRTWWDELERLGPGYGYHPEPDKSWIVVKAEHLDEATSVVGDTKVNITTEGRRYLGAPLGTLQFQQNYVTDQNRKD